MSSKGFFISRRGVYDILHVIILVLSLFLVLSISLDTFNNVPFYNQTRFMRVQFWICIVFLADFFIELFMARSKGQYVWSHLAFLLVSIPYNAIIGYFGWHCSAEVGYLLRFMPLIRGGYALAIVVGWFTSNRTASLFVTYLLVLVSTVYFCAMVFYVVEHNVNPGVEDFADAIWWAAMDTTTVGSNIEAVTPIGRVLSVALACLGMLMLPLFTVYLASMIKDRSPIFPTRVKPKNDAVSAQTDDKDGRK